MPLFESEPDRIEALQWTGDNRDDVLAFGAGKVEIRATFRVDGCSFGDLELLTVRDGRKQWMPVPIDHWLFHQPGDKTTIRSIDPGYFTERFHLVPVSNPEPLPR